jgi:hypothetical protein
MDIANINIIFFQKMTFLQEGGKQSKQYQTSKKIIRRENVKSNFTISRLPVKCTETTKVGCHMHNR